MKKTLLLSMTAVLLASPLTSVLIPAWAGHDMSMPGMDMAADTSSTMEGVQQDGILAVPHLREVRAAMAKHGMKETHHMMVMFTDSQTGKPLTEGVVAVKVIDPAGGSSEPLKMMLMGDGFGADISLAAPGKYSLEVGTKLKDAKKRVFTFSWGK